MPAEQSTIEPSHIRRLGVLPGFDFAVRPRTPMAEVADRFNAQPQLPGVMITVEGRVVGMISRPRLLEHLSRPFGQEIYLKRPVSVLLDHVPADVLVLDSECSILDAMEKTLHRDGDAVYEPIVVVHEGRQPVLLDVHTLLLAVMDQLRDANQTIRRQKEAAEAADVAKSQFLANMSHEIRTPLTAILGFAENLLEPGVSSEERFRSLTIILRNGEHLLQIINDILDLSKIEAGKLEVERIPVSPLSLVADTSSAMRVRTAAKDLELKLEFEGPLPNVINTDPTRLRQILINLLGNAIKFTEHGSVTLRLGLEGPPATSGKLRFEIIDTGIGMTEEQVQKLFRPFSQADNTMARRYGGTGLGLSISRRLCRKLGGEISVDSRPGVGTTFSFTVDTGPFDPTEMITDPERALVDLEKPRSEEDLGNQPYLPYRLLLADDGPDNQLLISTVLKMWGATVSLCDDGQAAFEAGTAAQQAGEEFDLILMDMQMPRLTGYEATGKLREHGYSGPIIALTANAMETDRQRCLDAGCDDYATKPIQREQLARQISHHVRRFRGEIDEESQAPEANGRKTSEIESIPPNEPVFDSRTAIERTAGDVDIAREIAAMFIDSTDKWWSEIDSAIADEDRVTLRRLTHTIKNSSETLGGARASAAAYAIESIAEQATSEEIASRLQKLREEVDRLQSALKTFLVGESVPAMTTQSRIRK